MKNEQKSVDESPLGHVSELLQRRDSDALDDLIAWYRPLLRALIDRDLDPVVRPKMDVSDVVQEACHDVARNFKTLEATSSFQLWRYMQKVVKHKLEDARRRFKHSGKRNVFREVSLGENGSLLASNLLDENNSPHEILLQKDLMERITLAISRLPKELQRVIRWRFRKNMTYEEIGEKVHRSKDDARMLINRCLEKIRAEVFPNGVDE